MNGRGPILGRSTAGSSFFSDLGSAIRLDYRSVNRPITVEVLPLNCVLLLGVFSEDIQVNCIGGGSQTSTRVISLSPQEHSAIPSGRSVPSVRTFAVYVSPQERHCAKHFKSVSDFAMITNSLFRVVPLCGSSYDVWS